MTLAGAWRVIGVGEVAEVQSGPAFTSKDFGYPGEGTPLLRGENIEPGALRWAKTRTWPDALLPGYEHLLVQPGDLILGMDRPLVSAGLKLAEVKEADTPALLVQRVARIRATGADPAYLKYALTAPAFTQYLRQHFVGTQLPHITLKSVRDFKFGLPSAEEQRRIVEILDDHLSRLDAAEVELARARQRTRALELAFVSALLRDSNANTRPLRDLCEVSIGGVWGAAPGEDECDVDVLRVTELRARGRLDPTTSARRSVSKKLLKSRELQPGDLLLEKSGGGPKQPVGRVGLVADLQGPSVCSNFMQLLRPNRSLVEPGFLHFYLNALHESGGTSHMQRASTNIRNIKASEYEAIEVPVPDLETQRRAVASARASAAEVDRLRSALHIAERRSRALRQALLTAAFAGRLTSAARTHQIEEMPGV